jgi:hypothetical protein
MTEREPGTTWVGVTAPQQAISAELDIELQAWRAAARRDLQLRTEQARRRSQGIVHTPPAIARGIVEFADALLRERFGLSGGVCDARARVIDPACGPGAFLAAVLAHAERHDQAAPNLSGFDVDHAALELAAELRVHRAAPRLELGCADVLEATTLLDAAASSDQVAVLLGNPPWSTARGEHSLYAQRLLEDFRVDSAGTRLVERKLGVLSDAYVRFFRVCAEVARQSRAGALIGLVTNASFLDGPVHRGMRAALLRWFDDLFVLDLGGSALLARSAGERDDNVFGVRPAVAITWLARYPGPVSQHAGRLHYARLTGDKASKLARIARAAPDEFAFRELLPEAPLLRFVPTRKASQEYTAHWSLADCMPFQREGVQSNRDAVVIDADAERLLLRLKAFVAGSSAGLPELAAALQRLHHYDPKLARTRVAEALERDPDGRLGVSVRPIAYRPFDDRYFCPVAPLCHRPRPELLEAVARSPLTLVSVRKDRGSTTWTHAAASMLPIDNCYLSARSSCRARAFPTHGPLGEDNLSDAAREAFCARVGAAVTALEFQHYALGCMFAPSYRARWDQELRQDYPRIPLPVSASGFAAIAAHGRALARLFAEPNGSTGLVEPASAAADVPSLSARLGDLTVDSNTGSIALRGEALIRTNPTLLAFSVGHHRPLAAYIGAHRERHLDAASLATLRLMAERVSRLVALVADLERTFGGVFTAAC